MDSRSTILVTGGAGSSARRGPAACCDDADADRRERRQAHLRRQPRIARRGGRRARATASSSVDICDAAALPAVFDEHQPDGGDAPRGRDRTSIARSTGPAAFIQTNVVGTFTLLEAARATGPRSTARRATASASSTSRPTRCSARSAPTGSFTETTPYEPNSPYSASKAASDHLVRAWHHTYGLPVVITNCSNNYGPYQFPEKLIPLVILNALEGKPLPVYGDGENVRDWLYVEDHAAALLPRARARRARRDLQRRRRQRAAPTSRSCTRSARCSTSWRPMPRDRRARALITLRHRPAGPRSPLRHRRREDRARARLAARARASSRACARPSRWYLDNADWCERVQAGALSRRTARARGGT